MVLAKELKKIVEKGYEVEKNSLIKELKYKELENDKTLENELRLDNLSKLPTDNKAIANDLINKMHNNNSIIGEISISKNMGHAVGIRTIKVYDNGRVLIKVMNPSGVGGSKFTNFNKFMRFIKVSKF